jgi:hypothetical protein
MKFMVEEDDVRIWHHIIPRGLIDPFGALSGVNLRSDPIS